MPARSSRPLLGLTLMLTLLAALALLFTAVAIDRATPEERTTVFRVPAAVQSTP